MTKPFFESPLEEKAAQEAIAALRILSAESVYSAGSGHLGAPLGLAPALYALWAHEIVYDPDDTEWFGRDRFILSGGHASVLYYALMHLGGFKGKDGKPYLTAEQLKNLRKLGSLTPAHPEYGHTPGVEMTTGPLGQGCAASVGMAAGIKWLGAHYKNHALFRQRVFVFCGDGDLMEGISSEAASLAGHWGLGNLIWIYDDNHVSIEGKTSLSFTENVSDRFSACGWQVMEIGNGENWREILWALRCRAESEKPVLIRVKTRIGRGLPQREGTEKAHGGILTREELQALYQQNKWEEKAFLTADTRVFEHFSRTLRQRGQEKHAQWLEDMALFKKESPEKAKELEIFLHRDLPSRWEAVLETLPLKKEKCSTRVSSGRAISALSRSVPWLLGGAADVGPSTFTHLPEEKDFGNPEIYLEDRVFSYAGRNFHFGIREAGMGAVCNGLSLIGLKAFAGTFLAFFDYIHAPVRLASMMGLGVVYIFSLDSIKVGEDGPTHQPVEQLAQLRAIPGLTLLRPADENECFQAWRFAIAHQEGPVALALSRQSVAQLTQEVKAVFPLRRGAYILKDLFKSRPSAGAVLPEIILMASGSELELIVAAGEKLAAEGMRVRIVSFPSFELFEKQPVSYRHSVFPPAVRARVAVELGVAQGWERYTGLEGRILSVEHYGESGDGEVLARSRGFTPEQVISLARDVFGALKDRIETFELG